MLRCKSSAGQCILEMTEASTVDDLAAFVVAQTGLDRESLSLRYGYPPKRIDLSPEVGMKTLVMVSFMESSRFTNLIGMLC